MGALASQVGGVATVQGRKVQQVYLENAVKDRRNKTEEEDIRENRHVLEEGDKIEELCSDLL